MVFRTLFLCAAMTAGIAPAQAQSSNGFVPELLADVSTMPGGKGSEPQQWQRAAGRSWFVAYAPATGFEPYVVDEATSNLRLVGDFTPGGAYAMPQLLGATPAGLFFSLQDGPTRHVWFSDGTREGSRIVASSMSTSLPASEPQCVGGAAGNGMHVLCTRSTPDGAETQWWLSDGTLAGTSLLSVASGQRVDTAGVAMRGDRVCVVMHRELSTSIWTSDGTSASTVQRSTLPERRTAGHRGVITTGGHCIVPFIGAADVGFFSTDTIASGTSVRLGDGIPVPGPVLDFVFPAGDVALFVAPSPTFNHVEVWRSTGTAAGTQRLLTIRRPHFFAFRQFASAGARAAFLVGEDTTTSDRIWVTDGTAAGTTVVPHPAPGAWRPIEIITAGNVFVVLGRESLEERSYVLEPATGVMRRIGGSVAMPLDLSRGVVGNDARIWLGAKAQDGFEPASVDIATGTLSILADLWPSTAPTFPAEEGSFGTSTEGHPADVQGDVAYRVVTRGDGAQGVLRMRPHTRQASLVPLPTDRFSASLQRVGARIAVTTAGTSDYDVRMMDAASPSLSAPLVAGCGLLDAAPLDELTLGVACRRAAPERLQVSRTDGTPAGTVVVGEEAVDSFLDLRLGNATEGVLPIFLRTADAAMPNPLRTMKATSLDGVLAPHLRACGFIGRPDAQPTAAGLVFFAHDGTSCDLWRFDATRTLQRLGPLMDATGAPATDPIAPVAIDGDRAAFMVRGTNGMELWTTNGTPAGTARRVVLPSTAGAVRFDSLPVYADGRLFVTLHDGQRTHTFVFDTATGIVDEVDADTPIEIRIALEGGIAFGMGEDREPWRVAPFNDGYRAHRLVDLHPGPSGSQPDAFQRIGDALVFFADDGIHGYEPFVYATDGIFRDGYEAPAD